MDENIPRERVKPKIGKNKAIERKKAIVVKSNVKEQAELEGILKEVLRDMAKDGVIRHKRNNKNNIDAMVHTCSEFMQNFIIMGYDLDNRAIEPVFYARTQMEADALSNMLQRYFVEMMHGGHDFGA